MFDILKICQQTFFLLRNIKQLTFFDIWYCSRTYYPLIITSLYIETGTVSLLHDHVGSPQVLSGNCVALCCIFMLCLSSTWFSLTFIQDLSSSLWRHNHPTTHKSSVHQLFCTNQIHPYTTPHPHHTSISDGMQNEIR